jgi:hypothetical protein
MASRRVERRRAAQAEHLAETRHDEVAEGIPESSDGIAIPEADLRQVEGDATIPAKRFRAFSGDPLARIRPDSLRRSGRASIPRVGGWSPRRRSPSRRGLRREIRRSGWPSWPGWTRRSSGRGSLA